MTGRQRTGVGARGRPRTMTHHDGTHRTVTCTDAELPFPPGELIVSQTDPEGRITMCNDAFVLVSGYSREEILGQPHHLVRHPDMPRAAFADLWSTVHGGHRWSGYVKNLRKDGSAYWVFATVIPRIRDGVVLGYTSVRREPSPAQVAQAARLYRTMLAAEPSPAPAVGPTAVGSR